MRPVRIFCGQLCLATSFVLGAGVSQVARAADTITFGIGTQDTTTNTASAGIVIRKLGLLQKYLPRTGKYAGTTIDVSWQNFTSGPPVTNGMMADKLQLGSMGDYPLIVNGYTFENNRDSHSELIAVAAYNMYGSGNGLVVNKASPYFSIKDLKGKVVSVPFGSAAHGMILKALDDMGLPPDYLDLVNQSPEVGSTNLQEQKIDGHADFVPFAELLPFRGFARKIFDGAQTNLPTWHGVVVRTDFAKKYPEIVTAYLRAMLDADAWIKADPQRAAEKISEWTGTDKEVVYIFLGPGGIMTLDPTIKPSLIDAAKTDAQELRKLGRIKDFDVSGWANDTYIRQAYAEAGLSYDQALASTANYEVKGEDTFCHTQITKPREAGEIWVTGAGITAYSSPTCTLRAYNDFVAHGRPVDVAYLFDHTRGIKLFAKVAFYVVAGERSEVVPFMLKSDADAYAVKVGGKVTSFDEALKAVAKEG